MIVFWDTFVFKCFFIWGRHTCHNSLASSTNTTINHDLHPFRLHSLHPNRMITLLAALQRKPTPRIRMMPIYQWMTSYHVQRPPTIHPSSMRRVMCAVLARSTDRTRNAHCIQSSAQITWFLYILTMRYLS